MVMNFLLRNKKGSEMILPPVIFIVLNIVIFSVFLLFVVKASSGALVYEQAYAKQVALLIDEAKSDMQILVDFEEGVETAEKNKKTSDLVRVDKEANKVIVNFGSKGGYGYKYFSDYEVNVYDDVEENLIIINVGDKIWPDVSRPFDFDEEVSEEDLEKAIGGSKCENYFELINYYSKKYEVNSILVLALIMHESGCDELEDNGADVGLMQINLEVHCGSKGLSSDIEKCREELKDPETNIDVGVEILRWSYDTYGLPSKRDAYEERVEAKCKDPSYQELYLSYEGWEAALRAYNGFGCSPVYIQYLDKVKDKLASLGGELDVA